MKRPLKIALTSVLFALLSGCSKSGTTATVAATAPATPAATTQTGGYRTEVESLSTPNETFANSTLTTNLWGAVQVTGTQVSGETVDDVATSASPNQVQFSQDLPGMWGTSETDYYSSVPNWLFLTGGTTIDTSVSLTTNYTLNGNFATTASFSTDIMIDNDYMQNKMLFGDQTNGENSIAIRVQAPNTAGTFTCSVVKTLSGTSTTVSSFPCSSGGEQIYALNFSRSSTAVTASITGFGSAVTITDSYFLNNDPVAQLSVYHYAADTTGDWSIFRLHGWNIGSSAYTMPNVQVYDPTCTALISTGMCEN